MFTKHILNIQTNLYEQLLNSTEFEPITNGREGAIIVDIKNNLIPIVRTTTIYNKPVQTFKMIHYDIIEKIKQVSNNDNLTFNNALIETYNNKYHTMRYHSDQALDLAKDSYICLFSCYNNPLTTNIRTLKIKNKSINECLDEIKLEHNSIVLFSLTTNSNYLHKIQLDKVTPLRAHAHLDDNIWLGITFRLSKTFIQFINEIPYFYQTDVILKLANENEIKEFYKYKNEENQSAEDNKIINYYLTISPSDILPFK